MSRRVLLISVIAKHAFTTAVDDAADATVVTAAGTASAELAPVTTHKERVAQRRREWKLNRTRAHDAQAHKHTHAESAASYAEGHPDVDPGSFLRMLNEERNKACHGRRYPDIFQGTFIDLGYKSDTLKYGHFKVDNTQNTQNIVFVSPEDVPDGYLSEGDRCEFRIVEYRNQRNRRNGTFQRKAVDVVCIKRAVPVSPQPSC